LNPAKQIIIIGNGAAGIEAARTIREINKNIKIFIFSEEYYHFYSRIHLSTFIRGNQPIEELYIYPPSWYKQNNIQVNLHTPIADISSGKKLIKDIFGNFYSYDSLIIASGARPFLPRILGMETRGVFSLRNLKDAFDILEFAPQCRTAVILGGGILGIESASSLNKAGLKVTVIEQNEQIMSQQLDLKGAHVLQNILEKEGISFRLSSKITRITGQKTIHSIQLESGENIQSHMLLLSTGIQSNLELGKKAGIFVNKGILVDRHMRTNKSSIFAAGDVAEINGKILGIWPAAVEQGEIAAKNALGLDSVYQETLPLHILKVAGIDLTSLGKKYSQSPIEKEIIHISYEKKQYIKIIHNSEFLLGAIILGIRGIGYRLEKIIKKKQPVKDLLPDLENSNWENLKKKKL
jgi:nitrite reductase (NADH) large subunit